jgi:predicted dehydrogenase/kynurenine formamidase
VSALRGLVIGAGFFSDFHLEAWSRIDEVEIIGVCDSDIAKAVRAANKYAIKNAYDSLDVALAQRPLDFVDIATPPASHLEIVRRVAQAGLPMICQKPLADDMAGANAIATAVREAKVPFMVHENFRFQPWYREIKKILDSDCIGKTLHSISMQTRLGDGWTEDAYLSRQPYFRTMPRLLVHETGVHFIDVFRYLAGEITRVDARLRRLNPHIAGEDCGVIDFVFRNGATGRWDANRYNESLADNPRYTFGEMLVECDQGSLWLASDGTITIKRLGQESHLHPYNPSHHGFAGDCVHATQKHFVDVLKGRSECETSLESTLINLEIVERVYASSRAKTTAHAGQRRVVDLSLPVDNHLRGASISPAKSIAVEGWNATTLTLYSHCGTHMDAPVHFLDGGATLDAQSLDTCCGDALVLDLTPTSPGELITVASIENAMGNAVLGKRLLLRTDWHKRLGTPEYRDRLPRISIELAHWLVQKGVRLIGVEPPSVADVNAIKELTDVHQALFRGGVTIVEGLANLDQLTSRLVTFIALPLKITGGDGCPVRAIAIENADGSFF